MPGNKKTRLLNPQTFLKSKIKSGSQKTNNEIKAKDYSETKLETPQHILNLNNSNEQSTLYHKPFYNYSEFEEPISEYPSLKKRVVGINSVLREEISETLHRPLNTAFTAVTEVDDGDDNADDNPPTRTIPYSHSCANIAISYVDSAFRLASYCAIANVLFIEIPHLLSNACCDYETDICECDTGRVIVKAAMLVMASFLLFLLFLEFLPRFEEQMSENSPEDRASPLNHLLCYLGIDRPLNSIVIRMLAFTVLLTLAPGFYNLNLLTQIYAFATACYFAIPDLYNLSAEILGLSKISTPTFHPLSLSLSRDDFLIANETARRNPIFTHLMHAPAIIQILVSIVLSHSVEGFFSYSNQFYATMMLLVLLGIYAINYITFLIKRQYIIHHNAFLFFNSFTLFYLLVMDLRSGKFGYIPAIIHLTIFLMQLFCSVKLENGEHGGGNQSVHAQRVKLNLTSYPILLSGCLLMITILFVAIKRILNVAAENKTFFSSNIKWCVTGMAEKTKEMIYEFDLMAGEDVVRIMMVIISFPVGLIIVTGVYFTSAERVNYTTHKIFVIYPLLLTAMIFSTASSIVVVQSVFAADGSWPDVAKYFYEIKDAIVTLVMLDCALPVAVCCFVIYLTVERGENLDEQNAPVRDNSEERQETSETKYNAFFKHWLSMLLATTAIILFVVNVSPNEVDHLMAVRSSDFTPTFTNPFEILDERCDESSAASVVSLYDSMKDELDTITNYKPFHAQRLLEGKKFVVLFTYPSLIALVLTFATIVLSPCIHSARKYARTTYVFSLLVTIPPALLSLILFPITTLVIENWPYTFLVADYTAVYSGCVRFNLLVSFVCIVVLVETVIHPFVSKSEHSAGANQVPTVQENFGFY